jgi:hypothetical protein
MSTAYGALAAPTQSEGTQGRLHKHLPLPCTLKKTGLRVEVDHLQERSVLHMVWHGVVAQALFHDNIHDHAIFKKIATCVLRLAGM